MTPNSRLRKLAAVTKGKMDTHTATKRPSDALRKLGACFEAVKWANSYDDPQTAWDACDRGDWMLWLLGKLSGEPGTNSRKAVVLCACECARLALPQDEVIHSVDNRPRAAIETAEAHCRGEATLEEVRSAAANAAEAAYCAAYAAYCAAYAAANAADAADAAYCAAYAAARTKRLAECADIVRKHFHKAPNTKGTP